MKKKNETLMCLKKIKDLRPSTQGVLTCNSGVLNTGYLLYIVCACLCASLDEVCFTGGLPVWFFFSHLTKKQFHFQIQI